MIAANPESLPRAAEITDKSQDPSSKSQRTWDLHLELGI
jgi:hypothetical protein